MNLLRFLVDRLLRHFFFFFNDTATTEIYTLSLHDALPIWIHVLRQRAVLLFSAFQRRVSQARQDRKSTRLNSSHGYISYAVFCLKKKKKNDEIQSKKTDRHKNATG